MRQWLTKATPTAHKRKCFSLVALGGVMRAKNCRSKLPLKTVRLPRAKLLLKTDKGLPKLFQRYNGAPIHACRAQGCSDAAATQQL